MKGVTLLVCLLGVVYLSDSVGAKHSWDKDGDGDFDLDDIDCEDDDHDDDDDDDDDHDDDDDPADVRACKEYKKKYMCYKRVWEGCHSCRDLDEYKEKCDAVKNKNREAEDGDDADAGSDYCDHDDDEDDDGDYDMKDVVARFKCCRHACKEMFDDDDDTDGDVDDPVKYNTCRRSCKREFDVCTKYMKNNENCERGRSIKAALEELAKDPDDDMEDDHGDPYDTEDQKHRKSEL